MIYDIGAELNKLAIGNEKYAKFNKKIVNTNKTVLGVRVPDLRKLAKKLAHNMVFCEIDELLIKLDIAVYDHVLLYGLIISYAKLTDAQKISLTEKYLSLVDSWAEVDVFVQRRILLNKQIWLDFALNCLDSDHEFFVRYGVIELMSNFLDDYNIDAVLAKIREIKHNGYYVKMAIAWLYATAAVDFFDLIIAEIKSNQVDKWIKQKALQKMIESQRISFRQKDLAKKLKLYLAKYR